ncbi:DUF3486 family protein [Rhodoferax sp. U2-2l]|uniref:phage protein Gp27 family protein n=1 Tax=Rhodoferax sp. U2-2l TaxID=2884000 RepID=UPI001D0B38F8|nr:phage protein Gp27 family protein [Rhodoferax sp. U2-2l]MCB8748358.1 DUF3486 family protein [Rhodoferax sp. U2-2l]
MGRKSTISRLAPGVRKYVEKLLREDRLTLDEMIADLQAKYPELARSGELPSKYSMQRYGAGFAEFTARQREFRTMANTFVSEFGEDMGDKTGELLAQMVTTVCTNAAMGAQERDDLTIKEVGDLSRAARAAMETRTLSQRERLAAEEAGRQKLLEEQRAKLDAMGSKGGVTEDTKRAIREALGIV